MTSLLATGSMVDAKEKRIDLILQQLEELPTLPAVAVRLLELTGRDDTSFKDVVGLISSDPSLTARILQLVHRADSGVRGEVTSIERAVAYLGFDAVRSAVLAVSVFQTLSDTPPDTAKPSGPGFSRDEFWKHSIAVACCAELLAGELYHLYGKDSGINPSEAFVCGLLHDLGKVALDTVLPKSFSRVVEAADLLRGNIADVERTVIGLDHMVVGKRLAERWQLPAIIRDCAWLHGQPPQALPASVSSPRMVNLITLADLLTREQHLGYSGNYTTSARQPYLDATSLSAEQVERAMQKLVGLIEPRAKTLGLGVSSSSELYQQALTQANKELGRVSGQLAAKNRRLAVRAKFFDTLSSFQGELRPDAAPAAVLKAIGETAVAVLGVKVVGAFSLPPNQNYVEAMLFDEKGTVFETTLIDCPTRPTTSDSGDGPVRATPPEMEWLTAPISPRLPGSGRFWITLQADTGCIGGVLWGAEPGESQRLSPQVQELTALAGGWALALRTAQIRDEAKLLAEQLAEANRQLHSAQAEIVRSRMMTTVGEMAAGAAHEMNNPLAVISGRSQLLASQLADPKQKHAASLIFDQSHRLSEIITELMDFAKPVPPKPVTVDLADLVGRSLHDAKMSTEPADRSIEVTLADVPPVMIDETQVSAALTEVIDNALQATDENTGRIELHAAFDPYSNRVVLTVTDNGCGMDEQTIKRAFDPFFSHKAAGRRRGMGLAKALRWVEASGGSIRLESRVGHGTKTIVLLPAVNSGMATNEQTATPEREALKRKAAQ